MKTKHAPDCTCEPCLNKRNRYTTLQKAKNSLSESYHIVLKEIKTGLYLTSCVSLAQTKKTYEIGVKQLYEIIE